MLRANNWFGGRSLATADQSSPLRPPSNKFPDLYVGNEGERQEEVELPRATSTARPGGRLAGIYSI